MSEMYLQRVTECMSDIGQAASLHRLILLARRHQITQKFKIAGQGTLYISVHDDARPAEAFLRVKGSDCSSELIGFVQRAGSRLPAVNRSRFNVGGDLLTHS
jgi:hypothetical protein